jgi:dephospho-CoA kinase
LRPIAVAITGGIGAGKSSALASFRRHGAATVSSDEIVHHLLATDPEVKTALVERLGEDILGGDGAPDRERIARRVFKDRDALDFLEKLLHPLVSREYLAWREQLAALEQPPDVCVTEVPLLFEAGSARNFDVVVVVTAPESVRRRRTRVPLEQRSGRLLDDDEKVRRADYAYVNDGSRRKLEAFVASVLDDIRAKSPA